MTVTAPAILAVLDAHAQAYDFPMPDNDYVEEADMRLGAFRGPDEWLIAFQEVCVLHEQQPMDAITAYGSHLEPDGCRHAVEDIVSTQGVADARDLDVVVAGRRRRLRPSEDELRAAGIENADAPLRPIELLRLVCAMLPGELFVPDEELPALCGRGERGLELLVRCDDWAHPDLASGEMPSDSRCLRSLAEALAAGDASHYDCPAELHNTHWSDWARTG